MHAAEQRVDPLRCVRQPVLQQHLDVPEPGFLQIGQERWEAHLPRPHLAAAGGGIEADPGLLLEQCRAAPSPRPCPAERWHCHGPEPPGSPTRHASSTCGWGHRHSRLGARRAAEITLGVGSSAGTGRRQCVARRQPGIRRVLGCSKILSSGGTRRPGIRPVRHDDSRCPPRHARPRHLRAEPRALRRRGALRPPAGRRARCPPVSRARRRPRPRLAAPGLGPGAGAGAGAALRRRRGARRAVPGRLRVPPRLPRPVRRGLPRPRTADGRGGAPAAGRGGDGGGRGGGDAG